MKFCLKRPVSGLPQTVNFQWLPSRCPCLPHTWASPKAQWTRGVCKRAVERRINGKREWQMNGKWKGFTERICSVRILKGIAGYWWNCVFFFFFPYFSVWPLSVISFVEVVLPAWQYFTVIMINYVLPNDPINMQQKERDFWRQIWAVDL